MAESNPFPLCISKSRFQQDCRRCSEAAVQGLWDAPLHLHAAYKLFATTTEHGEFLYSASFSCLPAFVHPHNFWRDFRAKIVTVLLRKKTQWITATSPVLNPVAAVMVFHGLTSLKKLQTTESLEQAAPQVGGSVPRRHCSSVPRITEQGKEPHKLLESVSPPVRSCFISLTHPKSEDLLFKTWTSSQLAVTWKLLLCVPWRTSSTDRYLHFKTAPKPHNSP